MIFYIYYFISFTGLFHHAVINPFMHRPVPPRGADVRVWGGALVLGGGPRALRRQAGLSPQLLPARQHAQESPPAGRLSQVGGTGMLMDGVHHEDSNKKQKNLYICTLNYFCF